MIVCRVNAWYCAVSGMRYCVQCGVVLPVDCVVWPAMPCKCMVCALQWVHRCVCAVASGVCRVSAWCECSMSA
jgi:hypothetical protein